MNHRWTYKVMSKQGGVFPSVHPFYIPLCPIDHNSSHSHTSALGKDEIEEGKLPAKVGGWGPG